MYDPHFSFFCHKKRIFLQTPVSPIEPAYCHTMLQDLEHVFVPQASRCNELAGRNELKFILRAYPPNCHVAAQTV